MNILNQWLIRNYNKGKEKLKKDVTWIVVNVKVNGSNYSYKAVNNNYAYSKFMKYET